MEAQRLTETIAAAKTGDPQAYEALLEAYGHRLYGYFLRASGRHHDAEDLLGELMLRLVRHLRSYDETGRFEPWLFRIAANMVRDRIRRARSRPSPLPLDAGREGGDDLDPAAEEQGVDANLLAGEQNRRLQGALERLDQTTREMILQRHFGEMSFREIAEAHGCPLGTALAKVHRGYKALRALMDNDDG